MTWIIISAVGAWRSTFTFKRPCSKFRRLRISIYIKIQLFSVPLILSFSLFYSSLSHFIFNPSEASAWENFQSMIFIFSSAIIFIIFSFRIAFYLNPLCQIIFLFFGTYSKAAWYKFNQDDCHFAIMNIIIFIAFVFLECRAGWAWDGGVENETKIFFKGAADEAPEVRVAMEFCGRSLRKEILGKLLKNLWERFCEGLGTRGKVESFKNLKSNFNSLKIFFTSNQKIKKALNFFLNQNLKLFSRVFPSLRLFS